MVQASGGESIRCEASAPRAHNYPYRVSAAHGNTKAWGTRPVLGHGRTTRLLSGRHSMNGMVRGRAAARLLSAGDRNRLTLHPSPRRGSRQGSGSHRIRGHSKGHRAMVMRNTLIKINISTRHGGPRGGAAYRGHFCQAAGAVPQSEAQWHRCKNRRRVMSWRGEYRVELQGSPRRFYNVTQASFEANGSEESCNSVGSGGALSLAGSASAAIVGPAEDITEKDTASRHVITLSEEEVFDVSLATFYVFDKEDARAHSPGVQLAAKGCGHGGCGHGGCGCGHGGARGCGGCGHGCRGCRGCARGCGGCGGCGYGCGGGCCIWIGPVQIC